MLVAILKLRQKARDSLQSLNFPEMMPLTRPQWTALIFQSFVVHVTAWSLRLNSLQINEVPL